MNIKYFYFEVSEQQAIDTEPDHIEEGVSPEQCFRVTRETMEAGAYRTALTLADNGTPSLYYFTTLKGISCYEVSSRNNELEVVPVSSKKS
jgi:hypothetical protein